MAKVITEDMTKCNPEILELLEGTHTLIAGTTGSGKSVMLNTIIYNIIRSGCGSMYLIDLKRVELSIYRKVAIGTYTEPEQVVPALEFMVTMMEERYKRMQRRNLRLTDEEPIYVIIDELADLVSIKGVLPLLVKLGRLGRAAKIHTVCATQDPSRKTLAAAYMQNVTSAIALRCRSDIESRQIIGISGAENLPQYGKGYLWDAKGIRMIDIPMTPQEDIDRFLEWTKPSKILAYAITHLGKWKETKYPPVDPVYLQRIESGLAKW